MDKTVVVKIERLVKHPLYGKYVRRYSCVKAHDSGNTARVADRVELEFCRPLSKTKRWQLVRIIRAAHRADAAGAAQVGGPS